MSLSRRQKLAVVLLAGVLVHLGWRAHDRGLLTFSLDAVGIRETDSAALSATTTPLLVSSAPSGSLPSGHGHWVPVSTLPAGAEPAHRDPIFAFRLRNTQAAVGDLIHNDRAILLRNALIDTASSEPLQVPEALRSTRPAEAFVVQANGPLTREFQDRLVRSGAEIVSYVPNNAVLVRADAEASERLAADPGTHAIVALEPYFKLTPSLLEQVLSDTEPQAGQELVLTVPESFDLTTELESIGVRELGRSRGPFGTLVTVAAPAGRLTGVAAIPGVHRVEPRRTIGLANDLTGYALGSTTNPANTGPFEGLTGNKVLVNVNDSGVDATAADLEGRVFTQAGTTAGLRDSDGHGTHVAGSIAGDGSQSSTVRIPPQGSTNNMDFQGHAPEASIFILPIDLALGPASGDSWLQETAATAPDRFNGRTNILISNNSWGYRGQDIYEYSTHSASFDAAVRDALPGESGDQPILYVFAAGNDGAGGDNGIGGVPDTILSPGNAKNVITVGALESPRYITNAVIVGTNGQPVQIGSQVLVPGWETNGGPYFTNRILEKRTDSDWQVAGYSSRGNVGIGIEGDVGRFKPDVVAPGTFIASVRSTQWKPSDLPDPRSPDYPIALLMSEVDAEVLPNYRFESGTSMAAPAVSGVLAQMQENFEYKVKQFPAASTYKAILINSARATSPGYMPSREEVFNYGGWGRPNLQRALGRGFRSTVDGREVDVLAVENNKGLSTGESLDFDLAILSTNALQESLRISLVWTDPPGDPLVGPKLVNDLDLIVSNRITGEIYWGNDLNRESGLSVGHGTNDIATNGLPTLDRINNVERIILPPPLSSNLVITVIARRVNVNSVRSNTNRIAQDFSVAFASDLAPSETNVVATVGIPKGVNPVAASYVRPAVLTMTNSSAFLNQRVGANSPLVGGTNGQFQQWQFYVFTNAPGTITNGDIVLTNGSNVVFVTFPVGNLSRGRTNGPDIDLYVSHDPGLTNLEPIAVAEARKSTTRGGNELVYFIGDPPSPDNVFYVGVKSEDHMAGEFGLVGVSTDQPLTAFDQQGFPMPLAVPMIQPIPDGTPSNPGLGTYMAINIVPAPIRAVYPSVTTTHENFPDLLTSLNFGQNSVVLQNHSRLQGLDAGTNILVRYDDTGSGMTGTQPSDGPGSLISFLGYPASGAWFLQSADSTLGYVGRINNLSMVLPPNDFGDQWVARCVNPNSVGLEVILVPPDASRLTVSIIDIDPPMPLDVYIVRDQYPDISNPDAADKYAQIPASGGSVSIGTRDVPPLQAGRYFVAVYNPNSVQVCYRIRARIERNLDASYTRTFTAIDKGLIPDVARSMSTLTVDDERKITAMDIGVRVDHPRASDLTMRLGNPNGYSSVLFENRGGVTATNLGQSVVSTNNDFQHVALTFDPISRRSIVFVNGQISAQGVLPPGFTPATSNRVYFGIDPTPNGLIPNAGVRVDDFGLWKRALRPQEIRDIYLRGIQGEPKQRIDASAGLWALWPFDAILGTTNPDGMDALGTNNVVFNFFCSTAPGQFPGSRSVFIEGKERGIARTRSEVNLTPGAAFTLEGWVYIPPSGTNAVFAGWWGEGSDFKFGPGLVSNPTNGLGSITAVMTSTNGAQLFLSSTPNQFARGRKVTNILFATFSENTNRAHEKIKFVPPPFAGRVETNMLVVKDDFEDLQPIAYQAGDAVRDWLVISNTMTIWENPVLSYNSSRKLMVLSNSLVRRTFSVVSGEKYAINFAARLVSDERSVVNPTVLIDGIKVTPPPVVLRTNEWNTNNVYTFRATKSTAVLEFDSRSVPAGSHGMLLEDVQLIQVAGSMTYLPEEPLGPLLGAGLGTWSLEVDDTRSPFEGQLLDWQLTLTFAPETLPAVRLTNGVVYSTNIIGAEPRYFYIDVPLEATRSTNYLQSLTGGPLVLWYNPVGLPGQGGLPDDQSLIRPTVGTTNYYQVLNNKTPPVMVPGQRYYLSVENFNPGQSNNFAIQVDFGLPIRPLTNNVPVRATNDNVGLMDYYSFNVGSNTVAVTFLLTNQTDELHLVARKGPQIPSELAYDYASTNVGLVPEVILIDRRSEPVPLTTGLWYLGVYSTSTNIGKPIAYTILASEDEGRAIRLTNGVPYRASITNETEESHFFIDITEDPARGTFALTNLSGNVDLYLRRGLPYPETYDFDYASTNAGRASEVITLGPGSQPVGLSKGRWFLTAVANDLLPVNFEVVASYVTNSVPVIPLQDGVALVYSNAPPSNSVFFSFTVPPRNNAALFEVYNATGPVVLRASKSVLPQFAASTNVFVAPGGGPSGQRIAIRSDTLGDISGEWFLQVQVQSTNLTAFTIRAALQKDGILESGSPILASLQTGNASGLSMTVNTIPGEIYSVRRTYNLLANPVVWEIVATEFATSDTLVLTLPAPAANQPLVYYRVVQEPQ